MSETLLQLPLEIQVALGGGYLGYSIACAGMRQNHGATEIAFRSLAFGIVAMLVLQWVQLLTHQAIAVCAAIVAACAAGALWRRFGMKWSLKALSKMGIMREDGLPSAWTALSQTPNLNVTQISVRTIDGQTLHHNRAAYKDAWKDGLYLGSDGSVVMVLEETVMPDGKVVTEEDISTPGWGTRLTYIPASQIARVYVRTPTST